MGALWMEKEERDVGEKKRGRKRNILCGRRGDHVITNSIYSTR
jgi:hypothetical protein